MTVTIGCYAQAQDETIMIRPYRNAILLFTLVWVVFCWPWLTGAVTLPYDAKAHFQAQIQFLAKAIHEGQSPFWVPNVFAGSPQIADPQSLIFSPALILAWLSPDPSFWAVDVFTFALLLFGGYALIGFFRDRGWHSAGALLAACIFAFGASAAWRIQHIGQIQSYAFLALALWLLAQALQRRTLLGGFLAGIAAGIMVVEPDQIAYLGMIILAAIVVDYWLSDKDRLARIKASLPTLAASACGGLLIVAAPLILTILFAESSNRPDISYVEATRGSLSPMAFLTFFFGDLFSAADKAVPYWGPSSPIWSPQNYFLSPNMTQAYCGALAALLLVIGFVGRVLWARDSRVFTCLLVFSFLYALGNFTPFFKFLFEFLPGISAFRRPADATFTFGFIVAILTGYVLHRILVGGLVIESRRLKIAASLILLMIIATLWAGYSLDRLANATSVLGRGLLWLAAGAAMLMTLRRITPHHPAVAMSLLALFMAADLTVNNGPSESTALPPKAYEALKPDTDNATIGFLRSHTKGSPKEARRDRVELVGVGFYWPNIGLVHGFDHTLGYNPLRLADFSTATGAGDTIAGPDQRRFTKLFPSYRCVLADLLGLRFIASSIPIEQVDKRLSPGDLTIVARTKDAIIYENKRALPRAIFVRDYQIVDFDQLLASGQWPEFDPRRTVLLEAPPEEPLALQASAAEAAALETGLREGGPHISAIQLSDYQNTTITINVDSSETGLVVLNDVWHPWWRAYVDGRPTDILKANVLFRAVAVPAGRHVVRFEFQPFAGALAELSERLFEPQ